MKEWEAETRIRDGQVNVEFADGSRIVVKNDGVTGYGFVTEYLQRMKVHYSAHLLAVDQILQRDLADDYKSVKAVPNLYNSHLAVQSMNCVFGKCDEVYDYDRNGEFNMEFTVCPRRATCRFNGYNEKYRDKLVVGCNPVYECGLTPSQARVADLLVNTDMGYGQMAEALGNSRRTVEWTGRQVFAALEVGSRAELVKKLKGKRLR
jgi:DNA-binding CsgD family transcriptional regulator